MRSTPPGPQAPDAVVEAGTRLSVTPYVPEIRLRVAEEVFGLWQRTRLLPYWAFPWAGGLALARHVLDHPALVAGRTVLDLASGSGLVAIAAAKAGAASVIAADIDPLAGAAITANARANDVDVTVLIQDLLTAPHDHGTRSPRHTRDPAPGPESPGPEPGPESPGRDGAGTGAARHDAKCPDAAEVVLAGDVFYERAMAEGMLAYLERARRRGAAVLVGDPGRAYLPGSRFVRVAVHQVPVTLVLEADEVKRTTIWRLP